jgi:iron complex outermembrane receptor protein
LLFGNYQRWAISGFASGPLSDTVRARLSFSVDNQDKGFTYNPFLNRQLDDHHIGFVRLGVDADPTSNWNIQVRGFYSRDRFAGPVNSPYDPAVSPLPPAASGFVNYQPGGEFTTVPVESTKTLGGGSVRSKWDFGSISLVSLTGFTRFEYNSLSDGLGTALVSVPTRRDFVSNAWSEELNLSGKEGPVQWLAGAYALDETENSPSTLSLPGGIPDINNAIADRRSYSIFADATYNVTDRLRFFAGARNIWERYNQHLFQSVAGFTSCDQSNTVDGNAVTGRLGAQYDVSPDIMVFGQYSRGYKGGGVSISTCGNVYKPEIVDSVESGVKARFFQRRLTINSSVFHYNTQNSQIEILVGPNAEVLNAPTTIWGWEADAVALPIPRLQFDASVSLLDARYGNFFTTDGSLVPFGSPVIPLVTNLKGTRPNRSPVSTINVGAQYEFDLGFGTLTPRAEAQFVSSYVLRELETPETTQKAYSISNFYLTYQTPDRKYQLQAFVKNAGNTRVLENLIIFGGVIGSFGPPRTYGVQLTANF